MGGERTCVENIRLWNPRKFQGTAQKKQRNIKTNTEKWWIARSRKASRLTSRFSSFLQYSKKLVELNFLDLINWVLSYLNPARLFYLQCCVLILMVCLSGFKPQPSGSWTMFKENHWQLEHSYFSSAFAKLPVKHEYFYLNAANPRSISVVFVVFCNFIDLIRCFSWNSGIRRFLLGFYHQIFSGC